jgi:hypothetical protein
MDIPAIDSTTTAVTAAFPPHVLDIAGQTPLNYLYKKLYPIAFADAVHDEIVEGGQQHANAAHHLLQCEFFNRAMPGGPGNPAPPIPPGGMQPGAPFVPCSHANNGLDIDPQFKTKSSCEEKSWRSVVARGINLATSGVTETTPNVIDGSNANFVPNPADYGEPYLVPDGHAIKTYNNKVYHVKKISWLKTPVGQSAPNVMGLQFGLNMGLFHSPIGGNYQAFVIHDHDNVRILEQLKKGPPAPNATLYYLMLPEYVADSASHKPWKTSQKYFKPSGVKILFGGKVISRYPLWSPTSRNTFFSRFLCNLTVTNWQTRQSHQQWTDVHGNVQAVNNATIDNNKKAVHAYIAAGATPPEIQLAYQRKRSGDQLQALAIKRMTDTAAGVTFHISSDQGGNAPPPGAPGVAVPISPGHTFHNVKRHTWLITHDFTLCAYALFLGINVLFTNHKKSTNTHSVHSYRLISPIGDNFN